MLKPGDRCLYRGDPAEIIEGPITQTMVSPDVAAQLFASQPVEFFRIRMSASDEEHLVLRSELAIPPPDPS
jgi:hypothetical protein